MRPQAGFTLVELMVTITIMVILLTLGTVALTGYQANARDEERKADVTSIAQQLESFYTANGDYPATAQMADETTINSTLPNLDPRALRDPFTKSEDPISLIVDTDANAPTQASLNGGKTYVYQPLTSANALCTDAATECRKFNLYYTLETDPTVKSITSIHQ